jgi:hypothetical protein
VTRRGVYRGIYSCLIEDPDYQRLSADARLVLLTLRLSAQAGAAAIFKVYGAVLAIQTGLEDGALEHALDELATSPSAERPWIYREAGIVWVRNALRYDPNIRLADPKHAKSVERAVAALPKLGIVARFCDYYKIASPFEDAAETPSRASEEPSPPRPSTEYREPNTETERGFRPSGSPNGHHPTRADGHGVIQEIDL